jgi:hypothetical protein
MFDEQQQDVDGVTSFFTSKLHTLFTDTHSIQPTRPSSVHLKS